VLARTDSRLVAVSGATLITLAVLGVFWPLVIVAPFEGVFGWYLQNQSEKPVVVHLKISGFYDLVPAGEYGNDAGIEANKALKDP
jgi:hypothetical protein